MQSRGGRVKTILIMINGSKATVVTAGAQTAAAARAQEDQTTAPRAAAARAQEDQTTAPWAARKCKRGVWRVLYSH